MAKKIEIDIDVNSSDAVRGVDNLSKSTDKLADSTDNLSGSTVDLEDSLGGLSGGLDGAISGAKGLGKQFLALIANPIGAVIAAIAVVLGTLFKAFSRTEEGGNKLNKGMNILTGVFNAFLKVVEPIASFIVDYVVKAFEDLAAVVDLAASGISASLEFLGFEDAAKGLDNFVNSTGDLIDKTNELSDLEAKLLKSRREQSLIEKQALIDAENLRQLRDDESNSLQERIEFNRQLGEVLKEQSKAELEIANDALRAAELKLEIDGKTTEALDGLAEAQLEILDIQERINGQQSEQLANENSLRNEGIAAAKERADIRKTEEEAKAKQLEEDKEKAEAALALAREIEEKKLQLEKESGERAIALQQELKLLRAEQGLEDENASPEQIREAYETKAQVENEIYEMQQITLQERFENGLILEAERNAQKELLEKKHTDTIEGFKSDSIKRISDEEKAAADLKAKNEAAAAKGTVDVAQSTLGAVSSLLAEGSAEAKAISLAQATISGVQGVQAAFTSASAIPIVGSVLGPIAAVAAGVVAAKNIQTIASQDTGAKSGGSGGGSSFQAPSISAPSLNTETLFSTQNLEGADTEEIGGEQGINQVRSYVVESDITNTQNTINNIEEKSEIG